MKRRRLCCCDEPLTEISSPLTYLSLSHLVLRIGVLFYFMKSNRSLPILSLPRLKLMTITSRYLNFCSLPLRSSADMSVMALSEVKCSIWCGWISIFIGRRLPLSQVSINGPTSFRIV